MTIEKAMGLAVGIAALIIGAPSLAQPVSPPVETAQGGGKAGFSACKADIQTLCRDAPSGLMGRIQCLKTNQDKLSPECMGAVTSILGVVQAKVATVDNAPRPLQACQQDLASLCPDLKTGEGGRMRCLRDNSAKLSLGCSTALKAARAQTKTALAACEADRARLCGAGGKPADDIKCLKERISELGAECRKLVDVIRSSKKAASKDPAATVSSPAGKSAPPQAIAPSQAPTLPPPAPMGPKG